ncbi:MAG: aspartyl protease family protein [Treponema sp.]|jgi:predicted aspartyl protease|nr:aspartyl protease family protein [Treponema sp.]
MGEVRENITLINADDLTRARGSFLKEQEVRQVTAPVLVDTGCGSLILTEATAMRLGLEVRDPQIVTVAGGEKKEGMKAGAVEVHWKDRYTICFPIVLPGEDQDLLGVIPLEDMDLLVDPVNQRLAGAHGDMWAKFVRAVQSTQPPPPALPGPHALH